MYLIHRHFFFSRVPVLVLPPVPKDLSNDLMEWFDESRGVFDSLKEEMLSAYSKRMMRLQDMPKKAGEIFWWPFTQHQLVPEEAVTVIDSRHGENFAVFKVRAIATVNGFIFSPYPFIMFLCLCLPQLTAAVIC